MKRSIIVVFSIIAGYVLATLLAVALSMVGIDIPAMFAKSWSEYNMYGGVELLLINIGLSLAMYQVFVRRFLEKKAPKPTLTVSPPVATVVERQPQAPLADTPSPAQLAFVESAPSSVATSVESDSQAPANASPTAVRTGRAQWARPTPLLLAVGVALAWGGVLSVGPSRLVGDLGKVIPRDTAYAPSCYSGSTPQASQCLNPGPFPRDNPYALATGATTPAVVVPSFAAAGGGSCGVQIDGDVVKSWHTDQTMATLLVSYWLRPSDRTMVGVADGEEELLINCQSDQGSISFTTTAGTTAAQLPKAAGTYVIEAGGLLANRKPGEIQTIINLKDSKVWRVTENGSFEITSFTPSHLAGSFTLKIGTSDSGSEAIVASATISGTFDLACTGSACS